MSERLPNSSHDLVVMSVALLCNHRYSHGQSQLVLWASADYNYYCITYGDPEDNEIGMPRLFNNYGLELVGKTSATNFITQYQNSLILVKGSTNQHGRCNLQAASVTIFTEIGDWSFLVSYPPGDGMAGIHTHVHSHIHIQQTKHL